MLTIEAKGEGEEVHRPRICCIFEHFRNFAIFFNFVDQDVWSRVCEVDCQGVHGVLHYTVHAPEKEFRLKARDGKEI